MGIGEMKRAAVFLDRDGVINRPIMRAGKPHPPRSLEQLEVLPGARAALQALSAHGYCLVVVTNQPDVARGLISRANVDAMNDWLKTSLPLEAVLTCVHDDGDRCDCRKPLPGLITRAARDLRLDCNVSYLVGDRWRDIEAGRRAGCKTFFVDSGYEEPAPAAFDFRVSSLLDASRIILGMDAS
jgi:D-glycero-D-manno-heptose 1,7-bisphosphate phosphatase